MVDVNNMTEEVVIKYERRNDGFAVKTEPSDAYDESPVIVGSSLESQASNIDGDDVYFDLKIEPTDDGDSNVSPHMAPAVKAEPPDTDNDTDSIKSEIFLEKHPLDIDGDDVYSDVKNEPADADHVCSSEVASSAEPAGAEGSPAAATVKQEMDIGPTRLQPMDIQLMLRPATNSSTQSSLSFQVSQPGRATDGDKALRAGDRPHICDVCATTFTSSTYLNQHMLIHTGARPFVCDVCKQDFSLKCKLKYHMYTHTGVQPFRCNICGTNFTLKCKLKYHMYTHAGNRPYRCNVCEKDFSLNCELKYHMYTHTDARPYICKICETKFFLKCKLKYHMYTHTGKHPYRCNVCGTKFFLKCKLKYHMYTHTGKHPYICNVCGTDFPLKCKLNYHMSTHTGVSPFSCSICRKGFSRKYELNRHVLTHKGQSTKHCNIGNT